MQTKLNPYINFKDNACDALEFYHSIFGGKLALDRFKDHNVSEDPRDAEKIMHGQLDTENGLTLMASDTPPGMEYSTGSNITISLSGDDDPELTAYYQKLSEGGQIEVPLEVAPWGDKFGMLTDKFGVHWMVNIAVPKQA